MSEHSAVLTRSDEDHATLGVGAEVEDQPRTCRHARAADAGVSERGGNDRARTAPCLTDQELGRGRSGVVYRGVDDVGRPLGRKVFGASGVTKAVQYIFLGAPNPYAWCEAAIRTAVLRRRIAGALVTHWFGNRLRVARAYGYDWNSRARAFEMQCELIDGRHVALEHPYRSPGERELRDLTRRVMKPLQDRLSEAGLDGLVWQAGRGNPVALNNFMCEGAHADGGFRWSWIDLESGVPALIPLNPLALISFYLPKSFAHRRPLFDDVDVNRLDQYIAAHRSKLEDSLGCDRFAEMISEVRDLASAQGEWKSLPRHRRGIGHRLATGSVSQNEAEWYGEHPFRWYACEARRAVRSTWAVLAVCLPMLCAAIRRLQIKRVVRACWAAVRSQHYRERFARDYLSRRIAEWSDRKQLGEADCARLREDVHVQEGGAFLADFGAHLAVKPLVKAMQLWVVPALWVGGAVGGHVVGIFFLMAGSAVRTLYTLARLVQNTRSGREKPWVALFTGIVPVLGNLAFPLQIMFSGSGRSGGLARFIMHDTFGRLGRWVPIWGGADTLTEHVFNRCPSVLMRSRRRPQCSPADGSVSRVGRVVPQQIGEMPPGQSGGNESEHPCGTVS